MGEINRGMKCTVSDGKKKVIFGREKGRKGRRKNKGNNELVWER